MLAGTPCLGEYFPEEKRKKSLSRWSRIFPGAENAFNGICLRVELAWVIFGPIETGRFC